MPRRNKRRRSLINESISRIGVMTSNNTGMVDNVTCRKSPDAAHHASATGDCGFWRLAVLILLVGNFFHPLYRAAVYRFGDGNMRHRRLRSPRASASRQAGSRRYHPDSAALPLYPTPVTSRAPESRSAFVPVDVCQAVRAPGSKVTVAPPTAAGSVAWKGASIRTVPVNQASGPGSKVMNHYG
jgi:hypothetical protein